MKKITEYVTGPSLQDTLGENPHPEDPRYFDGRQENDRDPYDYKKLGQLTTDHLGQADAARLAGAIADASHWIQLFKARQVLGVSIVLTGGYGIGKTTILHNMRAAALTRVFVGDPDAPDWEQMIPAGRLITASQAMGLMASERPLTQALYGVRALAIDDIGTEEIKGVRWEDIDRIRHKRYKELFDFCLNRKTKIPLLISSNTSAVLPGPDPDTWIVNPVFVEILGGAAWSRLFDYAQGHIHDLTGLPDYRFINPTSKKLRGL